MSVFETARSAGHRLSRDPLDFNPLPTTPGRSNKLKVNISLDSEIFVAGSMIYGSLDVTSSTSRSLRLGTIAVELMGYEELNDKDYTQSSSFLTAREVFQSLDTPPSPAVHGPLQNGMWTANKGKTTFVFAFKLPADSPGSFKYKDPLLYKSTNLAALRYVVTGVVEFCQNGRSDTILQTVEAFVASAGPAIPSHPLAIGSPALFDQREEQGFILKGVIANQVVKAGGEINLQVGVRNDTKRQKALGFRATLERKLTLLVDDCEEKSNGPSKSYTDEAVSSEIVPKDFTVDPYEERTKIITLHVPPQVFTVENTNLATVTCYITVALHIGYFRDIKLVIPVSIYHPSSIEPPPLQNVTGRKHTGLYEPQDPSEVWDEDDSPKDVVTLAKSRARSPSPVRSTATSPRTSQLPWLNSSRADGHYAVGDARLKVSIKPPNREPTAPTTYISADKRFSTAQDTRADSDHTRLSGGVLGDLGSLDRTGASHFLNATLDSHDDSVHFSRGHHGFSYILGKAKDLLDLVHPAAPVVAHHSLPNQVQAQEPRPLSPQPSPPPRAMPLRFLPPELLQADPGIPRHHTGIVPDQRLHGLVAPGNDSFRNLNGHRSDDQLSFNQSMIFSSNKHKSICSEFSLGSIDADVVSDSMVDPARSPGPDTSIYHSFDNDADHAFVQTQASVPPGPRALPVSPYDFLQQLNPRMLAQGLRPSGKDRPAPQGPFLAVQQTSRSVPYAAPSAAQGQLLPSPPNEDARSGPSHKRNSAVLGAIDSSMQFRPINPYLPSHPGSPRLSDYLSAVREAQESSNLHRSFIKRA
ncbi:uncharacterized protein BJ171DRAFT_519211 [Polychytrium aggregatum]|uniref:uncharacterized protein n=1 Tax=Polychytrium aggregatum TaxID=110093 RepID=UPI0022FDD115|nr:uncharacterized protein BJ171DRAFT_519211 [Polychytrium aggregatum]KAI9199215.1 hypothetical protein BJ171DRAFT_519211 [Polychytrium aggregatum]